MKYLAIIGLIVFLICLIYLGLSIDAWDDACLRYNDC